MLNIKRGGIKGGEKEKCTKTVKRVEKKGKAMEYKGARRPRGKRQ